jgi:hypothetical protein
MAKQSEKLKLNSIEEEAKACRKAFEGVPIGTLVWHCHHEKFVEFLIEPAENRIAYILSSKPQHEQALRLHLFRPFNIKLLSKGLQKADADRRKAVADRWKIEADWQKAVIDQRKADADRQKADADRRKAVADWQKADADWRKADADCEKVGADWQKADADLQKAVADLQKAVADRQKADADCEKTGADLQKSFEKVHIKTCKNCPWNGETIFPN